jgi:general secretion pathway protein I
MRRAGFTLLEVMLALCILAVSLTAIFAINSSAIYGYVYAKKLTVATLLARSKMTDLEQELYDKGFQSDDDEQAGDFSEEGWPSYKWRAKIIAPKTNGLSPEQLIGAIFNFPMGGEGEGADGIGALASMFIGGGSAAAKSGGAPPPPGDAAAGMLGALGPAAGLAQAQFNQLVDQLTKSVREVHLTVTWKEGKLTESFDIVTHVVSLGTGSDRNGGAAVAAAVSQGQGANVADQQVRADTCTPVQNPVPCPDGAGMCDPADGVTRVIPQAQCAAQLNKVGPGLQNLRNLGNFGNRGSNRNRLQ